MLNNRLFCRTARFFSRGGFTLVELLVVIGIIAILAGVALGPITNGIKKAKQSSCVQESHALGLAMYSAANDNSQLYPDGTGDASAVAKVLLSGSYVSDPGIFWISGDTATGSTKFSGAGAVTNIAKANVSWDFLSNGGSGASSVNYVSMPLLWSTGGTTTAPAGLNTAAAGTAVTDVPTTTSPFQQTGMVIFYINQSAAFVAPATASTTVTMVTTSNNTSGSSTGYTALFGL